MYAIIDVETTGFNVRRDKITEVHTLIVNRDGVVYDKGYLIDPGKILRAKACTFLKGVTPEILQKSPTFQDIRDNLIAALREHKVNDIFAYNAPFDRRFLVAQEPRFKGFRFVDMLSKARERVPNLENYKLKTVSTHLRYKPKKGFHRAQEDCLATLHIINKIGR